MQYTTVNLTKQNSLTLMLIFIGVIIIDSTIVKFSTYGGIELSALLNTAIFIILSVVFSATNILLTNTVRKNIPNQQYRLTSSPASLGYFHAIMISTLLLMITIMLLIIVQMTLFSSYDLILVRTQTYLSHLSPLIFISFLIYLFAKWLSSKKNYVMLLYTISFSLIFVNLIISLLYLDSYFSYSAANPTANVKPYSIISDITNTAPPQSIELLSLVFDALSLSSFLLMWIATAILLSQYRHRMGRIRYLSIICIPLIYYIFPFQNYFGDIFFSLLYSLTPFFSIIYILIFSATKQVGALLFGLSFWIASSQIQDDRVRKNLLLSAIGITVLFGSIEITPLQFTVYPPYGLVTESLIPLGAYLLVVGIFTSAKYVSQDASLRKQFYKSAAGQLDLLKNIGLSEMEKEYESRVKYVVDLTDQIDESQFETEMNEEDVKTTLHEVLNELYYSKGKNERLRS